MARNGQISLLAQSYSFSHLCLPAWGSDSAITAGKPNFSGAFVTVWTDPDFDVDERVFYYVRVLKMPMPRWTTHDARHFGVDVSGEVEMVHQERAYTEPTW